MIQLIEDLDNIINTIEKEYSSTEDIQLISGKISVITEQMKFISIKRGLENVVDDLAEWVIDLDIERDLSKTDMMDSFLQKLKEVKFNGK